MHTGDNLTGEGEGDDEVIIIEINKIPQNIHRLVFLVNIYDCVRRNQHFGMIENAFIRVVNASNNQELIRFNLSENYHVVKLHFLLVKYTGIIMNGNLLLLVKQPMIHSLREIVKRYC